MATLIAPIDFSAGTSGTQITSALIGATSMSGSGTNVIFSNIQAIDSGGLSMYLSGATTTKSAYFALSSRTDSYLRIYIYVNTLAAATTIVANIGKATSGNAAQLGFNSAGKAIIKNGTTAVGTAFTINAGQWYRYDWEVHKTGTGTGSQTCRIYTGTTLHSTNTADAVGTMTGTYTQDDMGDVLIGNVQAVASPGADLFVDYPSLSNTAFIGIYTPPATVGRPIYQRVAGSPVTKKVYKKVAGSPVQYHVYVNNSPVQQVDQLLVPQSGAWNGASTPNAAGNFDYTVGLAEFEATTGGREPDIQHWYKTNAWSGPSTTEKGLLARPGKKRSIGFWAWKPSKNEGITWADIAAGGTPVDARTQPIVDALNAMPNKTMFTIWHEPENDYGAAGMSPEDYIAMKRYLIDRMRAQGMGQAATGGKVVLVDNFMGYYGYANVIQRFYAGDAYCDWVAWDPYAHGAQNNVYTIDDLLNITNAGYPSWPGAYNWFTTPHAAGTNGATYAYGGNKPLMLAEWAVDTAAASMNGTQAANFFNTGGAMAQTYPAIKAWVYWNQNLNTYKYLTSDVAAKATAFANFVAHPHFNAVSANSAP